jgi:hypothetical protein
VVDHSSTETFRLGYFEFPRRWGEGSQCDRDLVLRGNALPLWFPKLPEDTILVSDEGRHDAGRGVRAR